MSQTAALEVQELTAEFRTASGPLRAVDGISFSLFPAEILGLVGESGCGKSTTALSILRLIPKPPGCVVGGHILFDGIDLLKMEEPVLRRIRGRQISMIFQEPMTALNPVLTVGEQVAEVIRLHHQVSQRIARERTVSAFHHLDIPSPEACFKAYPHQLSGGMRQRVLLAQALAGEPQILLADEPTSSLDTTLQRQIFGLLLEVQRRTGLAILLITHDITLVAAICHRVVVLFDGQVMESAPTKDFMKSPRHPYSASLIQAATYLSTLSTTPLDHRTKPVLLESEEMYHEPTSFKGEKQKAAVGCRYATRCARVETDCHIHPIPLVHDQQGQVRCLHPLNRESNP